MWVEHHLLIGLSMVQPSGLAKSRKRCGMAKHAKFSACNSVFPSGTSHYVRISNATKNGFDIITWLSDVSAA